MKKLTVAAALAAAVILSCASASAEGEDIKYSDVSAYINNYPIPCYSILDYCGVYVRDLTNYGFNVKYDETTRTVSVARDPSRTEITGIDGVTRPWQKNGRHYMTADSTDIRVFLEGREIRSFGADGYMMILLEDLNSVAETYWDAERFSLFVTLPGLPSAEYAPVPKAERQYTRYKPSVSELDLDSYYSYPSTQTSWGFVRVEGAEPRLPDWQVNMLEDFDGYYMDHNKPHAIYLTFDEGYEAGYTRQILDTLKKYDVPAAFFVTGEYLNTSSDIVREMIDGGFTVGNHTEHHKNLASISPASVAEEIDSVSRRLKNDFGYECYYMRPPEGVFSKRSAAVARDMGYNSILWSFAYLDYDRTKQRGADYAYNMMTKYVHDGAIMLLHAVSRDNADALERFIQYAFDNGYEFLSLDDLCDP